jgi:hypothetical protein
VVDGEDNMKIGNHLNGQIYFSIYFFIIKLYFCIINRIDMDQEACSLHKFERSEWEMSDFHMSVEISFVFGSIRTVRTFEFRLLATLVFLVAIQSSFILVHLAAHITSIHTVRIWFERFPTEL